MYHQIWIQNYLGFIVSDLMYTQMCVGRKEESKALKTIWEEEIGDL